MTFISGSFFLFLFITVALYFIAPMKFRWIVLLLASLAFYVTYGFEQLPFVIIELLIAYYTAKKIEKIYEKQAADLKAEGVTTERKKLIRAEAKAKAKGALMTAVVIFILILIYCKAGNKAIEAVTILTSTTRPDWMKVIVPLGVSYYSFSLIGYMANVYWKKEKAEKNILQLALFVFYFPKILQGPIANHKLLAPQLAEEHSFDYKRVCFGLQLALWGYFKKLVVADRISVFVNQVFTNYQDNSGLVFVVAALLASMQLYCDFSGCMDIAEGISEIFGITMEKNFERPFFSTSAAEFWRRWHITLGTWFKDYVYMPLVISPTLMKRAQKIKKSKGSRPSKAFMTIIPLTAVWLLTGIWHGTGMNYVVWGIYWGVIIIISNVFAPEIKKLTESLHVNTQAGSFKIFQMVRTYVLFSFGRLITVPGKLSATGEILMKIVKGFDPWIFFDGSLYNYGLNQKNFYLMIFTIFVVWSVSMLQEKGSVRQRIADSNVIVRWAIYYLAIAAVLVLGVYGAGAAAGGFTYMNY